MKLQNADDVCEMHSIYTNNTKLKCHNDKPFDAN